MEKLAALLRFVQVALDGGGGFVEGASAAFRGGPQPLRERKSSSQQNFQGRLVGRGEQTSKTLMGRK